MDPQAAKDAIATQLSSLNLQWNWNDEISTGIGEASQNMWKRAYRREYERRKREGIQVMNETDEPRKIELAFRIKVVDLARQVHLEWLKGTDQVLWESFCGLVHRLFKKS